MKRRGSDSWWTTADTWFIVFILLMFVLFEIINEEAKGAEYVYHQPAQPLVIDYSLKINGIEVNLTDLKCPEQVVGTAAEPVDFTACPKGYLCKPNSANGMRTLRIDEEKRYKNLLNTWTSGRTGEKTDRKK